MPRLLRRTLSRMITGRELWNGNREHWRNLVSRDPRVSIVVWSWTNHDIYRTRYTELAQGTACPGLDVIRLRTRREVARFLTGS